MIETLASWIKSEYSSYKRFGVSMPIDLLEPVTLLEKIEGSAVFPFEVTLPSRTTGLLRKFASATNRGA